MLTLVGVSPSWLVGWESSHVYKQTKRMIRVKGSCKGLRGWKHVVNGHLLSHNKGWALGESTREQVWACSERVGGAIDQKRESARRRRRSPRRERGEEVPRGGLSDLQSSPGYLPQTLLQSSLGDLNSPAIYKAQLTTAAVQVQAPQRLLMTALCWCSCLALSSPS